MARASLGREGSPGLTGLGGSCTARCSGENRRVILQTGYQPKSERRYGETSKRKCGDFSCLYVGGVDAVKLSGADGFSQGPVLSGIAARTLQTDTSHCSGIWGCS